MCGIVGVITPESEPKPQAGQECYRALLTLQHRGQDAAGMLTFDPGGGGLNLHKGAGAISQNFNQENLKDLVGQMAIGHTRYATVGGDSTKNIQPLVTGHPHGVGMVHNGNILNYHQLLTQLQNEEEQYFLTSSDLELLLNIWSSSYQQAKIAGDQDYLACCRHAVSKIFNTVSGAYSTVGILANRGLFAFRDPQGIRPLVLGKKETTHGTSWMLASESTSLTFTGHQVVRNVRPGELIFITTKGEFHSFDLAEDQKENTSHCMLEWVYFASANSSLENRSVYDTRFRLGQALGHRIRPLIDSGTISPDVVIPIPDTGRTAAVALADYLQLPYREGLLKNRYVQRSFILPDQKERERAIEYKLSPIPSEVKGKRILLVDDSVVRGSTSRKILSLLHQYGAKEIYLAITCPPITMPCFYGIDFPSPRELVAANRTNSEIATAVGADQIIYLKEEDLQEAVGSNQLCMACLNGNYPTSTKSAEHFSNQRIMERDKKCVF